jgi:hypothetical protein
VFHKLLSINQLVSEGRCKQLSFWTVSFLFKLNDTPMTRKEGIYVFLLFLPFFFLLTACEIKEIEVKYHSFFRIYEGTGQETFSLTVDEVDANSNYLIMGAEGKEQRPVFVKSDLRGKQIWARSYPEYSYPARDFRIMNQPQQTAIVFLCRRVKDSTCVLVEINSDGDVQKEFAIKAFDTPTYLVRGKDGFLAALGCTFSTDPKKTNSTLVGIDWANQKIVWQESFPELGNGDNIDFANSPLRLLNDISTGYIFSGYKNNDTYPYVCKTDLKGKLLGMVRSSPRLLTFTELATEQFAALYTATEGNGIFLRFHPFNEFETTYYGKDWTQQQVSLTDINGSKPAFIRFTADRTEMLVTGSTHLSSVSFSRIANDGKYPILSRNVFGESSNQYYAAGKARQMGNNEGFLLLLNTKIGFQRPINKLCLVKANLKGEMSDE